MQKSIRDSFISILSLLGLTSMYRTVVRRRGSLVRVLVFHDVQDGEWFKDVLTFLHTQYHVLTPDAFFERQFDASKINVLVTFDDGYASWVDMCLPILDETETKALFFINSGLVDTYGNEEAQRTFVSKQLMLSSRKTLSWDGVMRLVESGHTIGGHTTNHVRLSAEQHEVQRREVVQDKQRIEEKIGKHVIAFAYPFGGTNDFNTVSLHVVQDAGYTYAFTTVGSFARLEASFTISRMCIEEGQDTDTLGRWIEGGYDIYRKIKELCVR